MWTLGPLYRGLCGFGEIQDGKKKKKRKKNNILYYLGVDFEFLKILMEKMVSVLEKNKRKEG